MTPSAAIYKTLNTSLTRFFLEMHNELMSSFSLFFNALLIMYFVIMGYKYMMDEKEGKDIWETLRSCLLVGVVAYVVMDRGIYFNYVISPVLELLKDILAFILGVIVKAQSLLPPAKGEATYFKNISSITQLFTGLDMMFLEFMKTCKGLLPSGWEFLNPLFLIDLLAILILILAYASMYCAFVFMFLMSFFMIWVLFMIGGIVLMFGCFKETRGVFFAWTKMLFNYAFIAIFTALVVAICYSGISRSVFAMSHYKSSTFDFTGDFLSLLIWCAFCLAMTLKVPDLAAGLTGSLAGGTSGIAAGISKAGGVAAAGSTALGMGYGKAGLGIGKFASDKSGLSGKIGNATQILKNKLGIKS